MERIELVEKLREKADVTYEEARSALEQTDWDMLDAMIFLEKEGKVKQKTESYTTRDRSSRREKYYDAPDDTTGIGDIFRKIVSYLGKLVKRGNRNNINVDRHGERILSLPITAFVLLLIVGFWGVPTIMLVGLFFGFSYSFSGPDLGRDDINEVIGKATTVAENIKEEFRETGKQREKTKKDTE